MGDSSRFSALNTKLQAMSSKLLSLSDYETLLSLNTEKEIGNYLKHNTRYSQILQNYSIEKLKRWELELLLKKEMIFELTKLKHYLDHNYKVLIDALFLRAEVEDVKLILRAISRNENLIDLPEHFIHNPDYEFVSFERLLSKNTLIDLVEEFKNTVYEDAFRSITEEDLKLKEFHAEMNLDAIYFKTLLNGCDKLSSSDSRILRDIIGINIDLINLQWIYRAKKYYNLMDEEILNYTLLGGKNFSFKKLKKIIYSESYIDDMKDLLKRNKYNLKSTEDKYFQILINQYMKSYIDSYDKNNPMSIAKIIKYVHDSEFESLDLISIIEGARYNSSEIKKLLIKGGEDIWR